MAEVKKVYQNIKSRLVDENKLTVSIKNWYDFTNLKDFELHWQLVADNGSVLLEGNRKVVAAPQTEAVVSLVPAGVRKPGGVREMYLNLSWTPKTAQPFVGLLDEVAYDQFVIPVNTLKQHKWVAGAVRSDGYKVYNDRATLIFSSETGALISYMTDGQELLATPLEVSLYRPVTDNDNRDRNAVRPWKKAGLDRLTQ